MTGHWLLYLLGIVVAAILTVPVLRRRNGAPPVPRPAEELSGLVDDLERNAIAEIELDHAMGKLSDADYQALRSTREPGVPSAAEDVLRNFTGPRAAVPVSPVSWAAGAAMPNQDLDGLAERLVMRAREVRLACLICGARPEPEARFCSSCGRFIRPCVRCGQPAPQQGARFCARCGATLA